MKKIEKILLGTSLLYLSNIGFQIYSDINKKDTEIYKTEYISIKSKIINDPELIIIPFIKKEKKIETIEIKTDYGTCIGNLEFIFEKGNKKPKLKLENVKKEFDFNQPLHFTEVEERIFLIEDNCKNEIYKNYFYKPEFREIVEKYF